MGLGKEKSNLSELPLYSSKLSQREKRKRKENEKKRRENNMFRENIFRGNKVWSSTLISPSLIRV